MYDHTQHRGGKHIYWYCLKVFSTEEILKRHIKNGFKTSGKLRKVNMLDSKIMKK